MTNKTNNPLKRNSKANQIIGAVEKQEKVESKPKFTKVGFEVSHLEVPRSERLFVTNKAFVAATQLQTGVLVLDGGKFRRYELEAPVQGSARANALAGVIHVLESGQIEESGDAGVYLIFAPRIVVDAINNGSYRQWIATGRFKKGSELTSLELSLWARFVGALAPVLHRVEFRNIYSAALQVQEGKKTRPATEEEVKEADVAVYRKNNHRMQSRVWEVVADSIGQGSSRRREEEEVVEEVYEEA